jgi:hypothetical protein
LLVLVVTGLLLMVTVTDVVLVETNTDGLVGGVARSGPIMPNLLKIGFTTRQVEERVAELSTSTGVPGPFVIEGVFPSSNPEQHESAVHEALALARVESKEFFRIDLAEAIRKVSAMCGPATYLRVQDLFG